MIHVLCHNKAVFFYLKRVPSDILPLLPRMAATCSSFDIAEGKSRRIIGNFSFISRNVCIKFAKLPRFSMGLLFVFNAAIDVLLCGSDVYGFYTSEQMLLMKKYI